MKKFDFIYDQGLRHWCCDYEERIKAISWFKKKLRFIIKIRHLKAVANNNCFEIIKTMELAIKYKNKLESLKIKEENLRQREIAVLILENKNNMEDK